MKPITSFAIGAATFSALQILWGLGHAYGRLRGPWIMKTGSGIGFCFAVFVVITAVVCAYYRKPNGLAKCVGAIALGAIASMTGALFLIVANRHSLRWRNYRSGRCRRRSNWRSVSWSEQCLTTRSRRPTGVKAGVNEQFANEWGRNEPSAARLFRRTGIGVRFYVASLLVHDALQLALHRFERVVDHLVERLV